MSLYFDASWKEKVERRKVKWSFAKFWKSHMYFYIQHQIWVSYYTLVSVSYTGQ